MSWALSNPFVYVFKQSHRVFVRSRDPSSLDNLWISLTIRFVIPLYYFNVATIWMNHWQRNEEYVNGIRNGHATA